MNIQHNKIENLARFRKWKAVPLGIVYLIGNSTEAMGWRHGSEEWKVMRSSTLWTNMKLWLVLSLKVIDHSRIRRRW